MPLYMAGFNTNALHTLNRASGEATQVGDLADFGLGSLTSDGGSLAWDGTHLWSVLNNALHRLDRDTGQAARVGTVENFGLGRAEFFLGMAWDGTTLFGLGSSVDALYTFDRMTGEATRVGNVANFGTSGLSVTETITSGGALAWDGTTLFMYVVGTGQNIASLDRSTGVATRIGELDELDSIAFAHRVGLAWDGSKLWFGAQALYEVDRDDGDADKIGPFNFGLDGTEYAGGLAWVPADVLPPDPVDPVDVPSESLYMLGGFMNALFTQDRLTGELERVGNVENFGNGVTKPRGLAWDGTTLFMVDDRALHSLDRSDGMATQIGLLGTVGTVRATGLTWDGTELKLLNDRLNSLMTVNKSTGAATREGAFDFALAVHDPDLEGLAWERRKLCDDWYSE